MEITRHNVMTIPASELRGIADDYRDIGCSGMAETMHGLLNEIERLRGIEIVARGLLDSCRKEQDGQRSVAGPAIDALAGALAR